MQNNRPFLRWILGVAMTLPMAVFAQQSSSLNTFSPYTFYGIGDFATPGPSYIRSMGGAGIGFRNALKINNMNPASYSILRQKTFLFNVEMEGSSVYSKNSAMKTSHNSINVRDISLAFPLARGWGLGVSVTPLSSVGYQVDMWDTDPKFVGNDMKVTYNYNGEGSISQVKVGMGLQLTKRLSLGADMVYYHGRISRYFNTNITSIMVSESYVSTRGTARESVAHIGANVGLQYDLMLNEERILTLGVGYRPQTNLRPDVSRVIYTTSLDQTDIVDSTWTKNFRIPNTFTLGLSYQSLKWSMAMDYALQQWNSASNAPDILNDITFRNSQTCSFGVQFVPNPMDVRHILKRWSYRMGFRYSSYYMKINGKDISDKAVTFGVGIPIKVQGLSAVNVGLELGQRGRTADGMTGTRQFRMVRENYFKVSVGLSLFGEDDWFKRYKYQ